MIQAYKCDSDTKEINSNEKIVFPSCTDGAPAKTGKFKGFVSRFSKHMSNTLFYTSYEALVMKTIPGELKTILNIKMENYNKSRELKIRNIKKIDGNRKVMF